MEHMINPEIMRLAKHALGRMQKNAFIPASDPSLAAGGMPSGGDPAAAGGMPPGGDPAAGGTPPGGDPMLAMLGGGAPPAGGSPPPPPPAGGGGMDWSTLQPMIMQAVQSAMASGGSGGGGGGGGSGGGGMIKPKIDVAVEIMKLNKMVARIADALGIQIPAAEMVATPQDLTSMAQQQQQPPPPPAGAIPPIDPMQGMQPAGNPGAEKPAYDAKGLQSVTDKAAAIAALLRNRGARS